MAIRTEHSRVWATRTGRNGSLTSKLIVLSIEFPLRPGTEGPISLPRLPTRHHPRRDGVASDLSYHPPLSASPCYRCHRTAGPSSLEHLPHLSDAHLPMCFVEVRRVGDVPHFHAAPPTGFSPAFLLISATGHFLPAPLHVRTRPRRIASGIA